MSQAQRRANGVVVAPTATYIIGHAYNDVNYGGTYYTFTAASDCDTDPDVDHQWAVMPPGWNNQISSFKSYGKCATKIWEDGSFKGAQYGFVVNSSYVGGAMNDRTSSVQFN